MQGVSAGGKDKSRMKQAMLNRKGDGLKPEDVPGAGAAAGFGG